MADSSKFTDKAAELAAQAAAAAGPLKDKAMQLAEQAAAAAGPLAKEARERATELAGQAAAAAGPLAEQARVRAVQGVDVLAENLDKATGGKYSERIHTAASRIEDVLDGKSKTPPTDPDLKSEPAPLRKDQPPLNPDA
jgi:hypothetical protein